MSPLARYRASLAMFMACGLLFGVLAMYVDERFLALCIANVLVWGWLISRVSCGRCGHRLAPPIGSSLLAVLRSYSKKQCTHCGAELDRGVDDAAT